MSSSGNAILPILIALALGYLFGRLAPLAVSKKLVNLIKPLVWLLLISIGCRFGEILSSKAQITYAMEMALLCAALTTLPSFLLIALIQGKPAMAHAREPGFATVLKPIKECSTALFMVMLGVLAYMLYRYLNVSMEIPFSITDLLLYLMVALVGIDLVGVNLRSAWTSLPIIMVPVMVVIGSLLGGVMLWSLSELPLRTAMTLSTGFGWFTLSSVLVSNHLGDLYGTMALLTDLFRDLMGIILLYALGDRFPRASIGAGAATTMDTSLPIVKQTCGPDELPTALVSGLLLTLLAPFTLSFFLGAY